MSLMKRIAIIPAAVAACGIATGCFSYHKNVDDADSGARGRNGSGSRAGRRSTACDLEHHNHHDR